MNRQEILDMFKALEKELQNNNYATDGKEQECAAIAHEVEILRQKYKAATEGKPLKWAAPLDIHGMGNINSK
jgi:hypothetical protein